MGNLRQVEQFSRREMPSRPFHNFGHVKRVADVASSMGSQTELLKAAAYMHDIGHRKGADGHEKRSAELARSKLPEFGYTQEEADDVADAIMDTKLFQDPATQMGTVLSDADTHNFGLNFEKFKSISLKVKQEEDPGCTEDEWWESVVGLLEAHSYHGPGKNRYGQQKSQNLTMLREQIEERD